MSVALDPEERKAIAKHVAYELMMLRATANEWMRPPTPRLEAWRGSALLDSALLHLRNIHDFLVGKAPQPDDVAAFHFVSMDDGSEWRADLPFVHSLLDRIHKGRHHLSYVRLTPGEGWQREEIATALSEIEQAYLEFLELLPASERESWQA